MNTSFNRRNSKILIAGAGPAGASLAIRLAQQGFEVVLLEKEKFPRQKLCGEFISPECLKHFENLDVIDPLLCAGGDRIAETVFYSTDGKSVIVPTGWFGASSKTALGLSRAEMDLRLMEKAKSSGVEVLEESQVSGLYCEDSAIRGVKVRRGKNTTAEIQADLFVDATGRSGVLSNLAAKGISRAGEKSQTTQRRSKINLIGFKAHLKNVGLKKGVCEIYFFRGGYGGLNFVENNTANHCFLIRADIVKEFGGDADAIVENVVLKNKRAAETLSSAVKLYDWLAVSVDGFGRKDLNPLKNLISIGDAGAFIDPFTGSGMLMALESAEILADILARENVSSDKVAAKYEFLHRRKFQKRLRVCAVMRRFAFMPTLINPAIAILNIGNKPLEILARATRSA